LHTYFRERETGGGGLAARKFELLTEYLERGLFDGEGGLWQCNPEGDWACKQPEVDWPSSQRDGFVFVPVNTVVNAHYVGALREYGELAGAPGVGASRMWAQCRGWGSGKLLPALGGLAGGGGWSSTL
jgi:hypothetical protein